MPAFSQEIIEYHQERIREILVLKPNASARSIREALESDTQAPIALDRIYISKLLKKIKTERMHRFDQAHVETRLAEIQDKTQSVIEQMWRIILDPSSDQKSRVMAGKVIIDAEHKLLDAQMNAGIFERKLGTVDHQHHLAQELTAPILRALQNYGIIRANIIEQQPAELPLPALAGASGAAH